MIRRHLKTASTLEAVIELNHLVTYFRGLGSVGMCFVCLPDHLQVKGLTGKYKHVKCKGAHWLPRIDQQAKLHVCSQQLCYLRFAKVLSFSGNALCVLCVLCGFRLEAGAGEPCLAFRTMRHAKDHIQVVREN